VATGGAAADFEVVVEVFVGKNYRNPNWKKDRWQILEDRICPTWCAIENLELFAS
jgi:hypothetical protein